MNQRRMDIGENEIIQRVLAGERHAFQMLIERYSEKGMTLAVRILRNREDAEEALQDAFIRAYRSLGRFEGKSSFSTWFYRILFNVCASALRKRGEDIHLPLEGDAGAARAVSSEDDRPDIRYHGVELDRIVAEEIDALPPVYGGVFTLFFVQEMAYEEIAQVTGVPVNTVKTRLFRARALLREGVSRRLREREYIHDASIGTDRNAREGS